MEIAKILPVCSHLCTRIQRTRHAPQWNAISYGVRQLITILETINGETVNQRVMSDNYLLESPNSK